MVALPQTYTAKVVIVVVYDGGLGIRQVHLLLYLNKYNTPLSTGSMVCNRGYSIAAVPVTVLFAAINPELEG
jgi:hypothetical protein